MCIFNTIIMRVYSTLYFAVVGLFMATSFLIVESGNDGVYIVYMGASPPTADHAEILTSLLTRFFFN